MQTAIETLDYFPSFAQLMEINSNLRIGGELNLSFIECKSCDGYGLVKMESFEAERTCFFACSNCSNGIKQHSHAQGKFHGDSKQKFRFYFSAQGERMGYVATRGISRAI